MRFVLELSLDDAELSPDVSEPVVSEPDGYRLGKILRDLAFDIECGKSLDIALHDGNGNSVGRAYVDELPVTPKSHRRNDLQEIRRRTS